MAAKEFTSLLQIMPAYLLRDPQVHAAAEAIDKELQTAAFDARRALVLGYIDELNEAELDMLAFEWRIEFYDPSAELDIKRGIVKNGLTWRKSSGTPAIVEMAAEAYFGDATVVEWFDGEGMLPYEFDVETGNLAATQEYADKFIAIVNLVKNARSRLRRVIAVARLDNAMYVGHAWALGGDITIKPR